MQLVLAEKKIHLIGVGGCGMLGIAQLLIAQDYTVTGSDLNLDHARPLLIGAHQLYDAHTEDNIQNVDLVIYSSAISENNVELKSARHKNIACISRSMFLTSLEK